YQPVDGARSRSKATGGGHLDLRATGRQPEATRPCECSLTAPILCDPARGACRRDRAAERQSVRLYLLRSCPTSSASTRTRCLSDAGHSRSSRSRGRPHDGSDATFSGEWLVSNWSLAVLLSSLHEDIQQRLTTARKAIAPPGAKGDASETVWLELLGTYLP